MFKYGGFKLFLFKILIGLVLIASGIFVLVSVGTNSLEDPGLGKLQSYGDITNFFGYFGALTSSMFLFLFGIYSYVIGFFIFFIGALLFFGFLAKNIFLKFFLTLFSSLLFNNIFVFRNNNLKS